MDRPETKPSPTSPIAAANCMREVMAVPHDGLRRQLGEGLLLALLRQLGYAETVRIFVANKGD